MDGQLSTLKIKQLFTKNKMNQSLTLKSQQGRNTKI